MNPFSDATPVRGRFGAPPFISPEQSRDPAATDARTDLYAVGTMAFLMLTGELPDEGRPAIESIPGVGTGLGRWVKRFHAKIVLVDDAAAYVGSANFLGASLLHSLEAGVEVHGPNVRHVVVAVEAMIRASESMIVG